LGNSAHVTNTIGRAELAALAAAVTHDQIHIGTDSLTLIHQIIKQILCPEKHLHHVQGDILEFFLIPFVNLNPTSSFINFNLMPELPETNMQTPLPNTKPATEIFSQMKHSWNNLSQNTAETINRTAGPGGNPFFDVSWLALEEVDKQGSGTEASQHDTRLTNLPNLQAPFKPHLHLNLNSGYAFSKKGYFFYHQSLLPHVCRGISNALWSMHVQSLSPNEIRYLLLPHPHSLWVST